MRNLNSDFCQISSYESQPGEANGMIPGEISKQTQGFGRADAGPRAGCKDHQGHPSIRQFSFFIMTSPFWKNIGGLIELIRARLFRFIFDSAGHG